MKMLRAGVVAIAVPLVVWAHARVAPAAASLDTTPFYAAIADPESLTKNLQAHLTRAQQKLDELVAVKGTRTVDNTLRVYDEMLFEIQSAQGPANALANLHPDERMRQAGDAILVKARTFDAEKSLNRGVYEALAGVDANRADAETRYYLARELKAFRLAGVDKDEATRERLRQLRADIASAVGEFRRNLRESRTITLSGPEELTGLPADFIARQKPGVTGKIELRADPGSNYAVLLFAQREDLRKRFFTEIANIAYPANMAVLDRLLALRWETAHLLGFDSWAAYEDASRMVGSANAASDFIDRAIREATPKAHREYQDLIERKQQDVPGAKEINAWEYEYYRELVRRANYDFDSQSVRPYFAYDRVQQGLLDVATRIFGVSFRPAKEIPVWHPSVQAFDVLENNRLIGRIYFDTHSRPNKQTDSFTSAAWPGFADRTIPESIVVESVASLQPGDPGLLTYQTVNNPVFHEFAHAMTNMFAGRQRWFGLTRWVEDDYTEVNAMLFEHWAWNASVLPTYARHYQTNEPMPVELADKMRRAAEFSKGTTNVSSLTFARLAFDLHARDPKTIDSTGLLRETFTAHAPWLYAEGTHRQAGWFHLGNLNYSSGYYAYQWALTIAKDMLATRFDQSNLLAPEPAHRLRDVVMRRGGSKPAADIVKDFLGRPFNAQAWSAWVNADSK
jgi:thimet oligopeptidase